MTSYCEQAIFLGLDDGKEFSVTAKYLVANPHSPEAADHLISPVPTAAQQALVGLPITVA